MVTEPGSTYSKLGISQGAAETSALAEARRCTRKRLGIS